MDEYRGIGYLRQKLAMKSTRVNIRYRYYEQKVALTQRSAVIPAWLKGHYRTVCGWNTRNVDALADRLVFEGFKDNTDYFGAMQIFNMNNPDILFDAAIRESLIGSCSFVHISHGDNGERTPKLSVLTAYNATGIMDEFSMLLKEGYAVLDRDDGGAPVLEAYFTKEGTQYYEKGVPTVWEDNPAKYPLLVPVVYRPDSKRPFGHSRITRACMDYQLAVQSILERADISAEFYSFPQRYVTGTDPDADPLDSWRATISSYLRFDKDESGDKPTLGQFNQQSMAPHLEHLRGYASLFAGETGLTLDDLGFNTDNPSSAEAIKAAHETLRLTARKAQRTYGTAFTNVGYVAACLRDEMPYSRSLVVDCVPQWAPVFEPDAAAITAVGDAAIKINQAVPNYFNRDNLRALTGIESEEEAAIDLLDSEA